MEIPRTETIVDSLIPKARRSADLSEDLSILKPFQLEGVRQFVRTTLHMKDTSQRTLHTRHDFNQRHGKRMPEFRGENMSLERDIEALAFIEEQINKKLAA